MTTLRRADLDAGPFTPERIDALVAAIDVNDAVDLDAKLAASITLDHPAERFVDGFRLSRQLWREGFDWRALDAMAARLARGETLSPDEQRRFKQVRARFKHLRFAFFLYDARHRSPPMLSLVTLVLGELQDAFRVRGPREVRRQAFRLRLLLTAPARLLLARETDRLKPSDPAGFRRFTLAEIASLRPLLTRETTGAHAFHAARKVVSRQVSFHDDMRTLHPSPEHRPMARALATLNGLMGRLHDELVARDAAGTFRYAIDDVAMPDDIHDRLAALVELYLGTSSSESPAA